jgi:hypothetical protein
MAAKKATKKTTKTTAAPAPESTIKNAWLIWVGSEHYAGISDWSDEAIALGISKRLPNAAMARSLLAPGTVVFVAHDEGETTPCPACPGEIQCPDCRKRTNEMAGLRKSIDALLKAFKGDFDTEAPRALQRSKELRERDANALLKECEECKVCDGKGKYKASTGGHVELVDGAVWDYRTYNYWLHQPKKFHVETSVASKEMCETCGGTGELPDAKIFGMFMPERAEYIATGEESAEELKKMKGFKIVKPTSLAEEAKRKCGVRKPGGVYVVTSSDAEEGGRLLDDAVKAGLVKTAGASVHGNFLRFTNPVTVAEKRFRGLKRIDLGAVREAAAQAEMITDALEG